MTINYTTLLGLAQPVTGTEQGTWGDTVNTEITALIEEAVAGGESISVTAGNVTLTDTAGQSNQARNAVLIITGTPGTTRNVVAPSQSKVYVVVNNSDGAVVIKGSATTGATIGAGQTALVAWNGSDFVIIGNYVHGNFVVNGNLTVNGDSTLGNAGADTTTVNGQFIAANSNISKATTLSTSAPALTWVKGATYTDTVTAGGTTQAHAPFNQISAPVLSTSNIVTYTNASTVYIGGAPSASGSVTITNPRALFINSGAAYFGGQIEASAGSVSAPAYTTTGDLNTGIFFPAADTIAFAEGGAEAMRIDSSGRLLVGTSTSRQQGYGDNSGFQIEGTTYPAGSIGVFVNTNDAIGPSLNFGKSRGTTVGSNTVVQDGDVLGVIAFSGADGTDARTLGARIQANVDGTPGTNDMPGRLTFSTTADNSASPTERMRIDSSGNVGIGTTAPQAVLDLGSGTSGRAITWSGSATARYTSIFTAVSSGALVLGADFHGSTSTDTYVTSWTGTAAASGIRLNLSGTTGIQFFTDASAAKTAGDAFTPTERMRIDSSGNVGIGTSSAGNKLTVQGTTGQGLTISSSDTTSGAINTGPAVVFEGHDGSVAGRTFGQIISAKENATVGNYASYMSFWTRANGVAAAERMRITSAGEVLVGGTTEIGAADLTVQRTNGSAGINLYRNDTTVSSTDVLGRLEFYGNDTTSNTPTRLAYIHAAASGTHAAGDNPTDLVFGTTPDGTETVAEAGRITQSGAYVLKGGTTTAAAGVGIIFPATQVASADVNCLDDYEEGTFTPSWAFSTSGSVTYTNGVRNGKYTKIGNRVFFEISLQTASISSPTGDATITGLPFTSSSVNPNSSIYVGYKRRWATDMPNLTGLVSVNATSIILIKSASNVTTEVYLLGSDFSASTNYNTLYIAGHYSV